jgi:hypothetical protein
MQHWRNRRAAGSTGRDQETLIDELIRIEASDIFVVEEHGGEVRQPGSSKMMTADQPRTRRRGHQWMLRQADINSELGSPDATMIDDDLVVRRINPPATCIFRGI